MWTVNMFKFNLFMNLKARLVHCLLAVLHRGPSINYCVDLHYIHIFMYCIAEDPPPFVVLSETLAADMWSWSWCFCVCYIMCQLLLELISSIAKHPVVLYKRETEHCDCYLHLFTIVLLLVMLMMLAAA